MDLWAQSFTGLKVKVTGFLEHLEKFRHYESKVNNLEIKVKKEREKGKTANVEKLNMQQISCLYKLWSMQKYRASNK